MEPLEPVIPRRRCLVCGVIFELWQVKVKPDQRGPKWTRAKLCGRSCQNIARSTAMEQAHELASTDPERYQQWMGRDYSAMGKKRAELGGQPATKEYRTKRSKQVRQQLSVDNVKRKSITRGKGW